MGQGGAANTTQTTIGNNNAGAEMNNYKVGANQLNALMGVGQWLGCRKFGSVAAVLGGGSGWATVHLEDAVSRSSWRSADCGSAVRLIGSFGLGQMADIAQLLSNAAETKADFNFGKLNDAYWAGLENAYKQKARNVFEDPSLYGPDGKIDTNKATKALFGLGVPGIEAADKLADVGLKRSQAASGDYWRTHGFDDGLQGFPPSISSTRNANTPVAENLTQGRRSSAQPEVSLKRY